MPELWRADIMYYDRTIVFNSVHFYAKLLSPHGRWTILQNMSEEMATQLNEFDEFQLAEPGEVTHRFETKAKAEQAAIYAYERLCFDPSASVLVKGDGCEHNPSRPLAGNTGLMVDLRELFDEAVACGFWEGDEILMEDIYQRWREITKTLNCHVPPLFGEGRVSQEDFSVGIFEEASL